MVKEFFEVKAKRISATIINGCRRKDKKKEVACLQGAIGGIAQTKQISKNTLVNNSIIDELLERKSKL